ncbi:MAG TPA: DsbA family protein [Allosphingosinicella sp.]
MSGTGDRRPGGWLPIILASIAGLAIGVAVMLFVRGPGSDQRVEQVVHNYIMDNPEILPEAMAELERKQASSAVGPRRAQFETPYAGAWAGAQDGDVVLVEFFDYACGYCKASNEAIDRLLQEDPRLKVVWRELPVLGPDSQQAAFASLAAADQGRFRQFYSALFAAGRPTSDAVARAMAQAGVQASQPSDAHRSELARNMELANLVRATGTPTFIVGEQVFHGAVPYEELKQAVDEARQRRGS